MSPGSINSPLRVGIMGVAGISHKMVVAISHPESGCKVLAVASRSKEKVENFVHEMLPGKSDVKICSGSNGYQDLIDIDTLDAVYIPLPVVVKKDFVIKSLKAGKHVMLEKPVALTASDFQEILQTAYSCNKFVMDGTMFPHHMRTSDILETVTDDSSFKLGTVHHIESSFSFMADDAFHDENIRARKDGDPHGCIGDLGWYCIRLALLVFGKLGSKPKDSHVIECSLNKHGVPIDVTCIVRFEDNRLLLLSCSFRRAFRQSFTICGSRRTLSINDLVLPMKGPNSYKLSSSEMTKYDLLHVLEEEMVESVSDPVQEVLMWKNFANFAKCIDGSSPSTNPQNEWAGDSPMIKKANESASTSLTNQKVVDSLMTSMEKGCVVVEV